MTPINIDFATLNLITLSPMLITLMGALAILIIDLIKPSLDKTLYVALTILTLFIALGATIGLETNIRGLFDTILIDGISILGMVIILAGSMLFIPLALTKRNFHDFSYPEYFALFLFMVTGFLFMVASDNLILIFVGLETASLALYTLIAMHNTKLALEAAIKYFIMGALAASFFAMGAAAIYGVTGSVEIATIAKVIEGKIAVDGAIIPIIGGALLMLVAIGVKVSLIPFHMWTPDAYEGASAAMAGYMSIIPKVAMMVVAIRLFNVYIELDIEAVRYTIIVLAVVTTTLANMMALVQSDVKRMLAYSSISHAGFVLVAVAIGTIKGYSSIFIYYALFLFANLGAFTMLWVSRHKHHIHHDRYHHPYEKFAGMIKKAPVAAVIMALFMLSLAGVPPFSIFWGKFYVLSSVIDAGYLTIALILALNSAIAIYYYLKLIVYMFLKSEDIAGDKVIYVNRSLSLEIIIGIAVLITITSVFYIEPLLEYVTHLVASSGLIK